MIRFVKYKDIDKNKWDNCIADCYNSIIYAFSWYLDIVTLNKWDAFIADDYKAVMPLPSKKKFGIKYLYQPLFTQQLGVFSKSFDELLINDFINITKEHFRFAEYNFNVGNINSYIKENFIKNINLELNLEKPYADIFSSYSNNHKRNIKKAKENNISINYNVDFKSIIELFKKDKGARLNSFTNKSYIILNDLLTLLAEKGLIKSVGAFCPNEKEPICGVIFLKDNIRQIFLFSGNSLTAKETGVMHMLVDSYIEQCCKNEQILDFEGSNDENLARFYKGFGAEEKCYYSLRINNLPSITKRFLYLYKKFR